VQECTHALLLRGIHILDEGSAASLPTSEQAGGGHSSADPVLERFNRDPRPFDSEDTSCVHL
jgi:hypothetical protein